MGEYIDRKQAIDALLFSMCGSGYKTLFVREIRAIPAEDVAPVVHGRWNDSSDRPDTIICSQCDSAFDVWKHESKDFFYCPHCGAKMDKEKR